ncbi:hypothetical protein C834K_0816 [Chlamydia poikilotherma]|uniref:Uncharacterized protein n=1 Tax=Chlamydia poikilotherma TaxID=1967783 RepID=A0A3B0PWM0_9CHLA|nr:hypothetical protein [Chlamydia poikilotherma]SYX09256.1 hypothetical protein C834K_0816 [Chlamydia poikilotherma]
MFNGLQQNVAKANKELVDKTTAYQKALSLYNTILQQIEDISTLIDVQLILSVCNELQEALYDLMMNDSSPIDVLKALIIHIQTEGIGKTNRILKWRKSHYRFIKELNNQINSFQKEKLCWLSLVRALK